MVAQERHFSRAADRLHVAQSALSLQIQRLEADLGVRLFNRGKRAAVTLTNAGEMFLTEATAALRQMERAEQIGRMAGRGEFGQIELGYVISAATSGLLPQTVGRFYESRPSVQFRLVAMETPRQLAAISDGLLDIGLVRPRADYPEGVRAQVIHREPLLLALSTQHPLAGRDLHAPDLANETFIIPQFDDAGGFVPILAALSLRIGVPIDPVHRVTDFVTALCLASARCGVALVPQSIQTLGIPGLVYQAIVGFDETVELALAWRKDERSPSSLAFVEECLRVSVAP